jgi:3,4-dihydroxy-2-butanone 4-phosphate synthase
MVIVDDADREDEGDLILPAARITEEQVAFLRSPVATFRGTRVNAAPSVRGPLRTRGRHGRNGGAAGRASCCTRPGRGVPRNAMARSAERA